MASRWTWVFLVVHFASLFLTAIGPCTYTTTTDTGVDQALWNTASTVANIGECQDACTADPACLSAEFLTAGGTCFRFHTATVPLSRANSIYTVKECSGETCSYSDQVGKKGPQNLWTGFKATADLDACKTFCGTQSKCIAGEFNSGSFSCYLYSSEPTLTADTQTTFFLRTCVADTTTTTVATSTSSSTSPTQPTTTTPTTTSTTELTTSTSTTTTSTTTMTSTTTTTTPPTTTSSTSSTTTTTTPTTPSSTSTTTTTTTPTTTSSTSTTTTTTTPTTTSSTSTTTTTTIPTTTSSTSTTTTTTTPTTTSSTSTTTTTTTPTTTSSTSTTTTTTTTTTTSSTSTTTTTTTPTTTSSTSTTTITTTPTTSESTSTTTTTTPSSTEASTSTTTIATTLSTTTTPSTSTTTTATTTPATTPTTTSSTTTIPTTTTIQTTTTPTTETTSSSTTSSTTVTSTAVKATLTPTSMKTISSTDSDSLHIASIGVIAAAVTSGTFIVAFFLTLICILIFGARKRKRSPPREDIERSSSGWNYNSKQAPAVVTTDYIIYRGPNSISVSKENISIKQHPSPHDDHRHHRSKPSPRLNYLDYQVYVGQGSPPRPRPGSPSRRVRDGSFNTQF